MTINWNQVPSPIHFDCAKHSDYVEISHWMQKNQIRRYVYAWFYNNELHYIGMSGDNARRYGDRITREAGHFSGWKNKLQVTTSGRDIYKTASEMYPLVHKDNLQLKVWNFTYYPFRVESKPNLDLEVAEDDLIESHKKTHGSMPLWNKRDMGYAKKRAVITDDSFDSFFFTTK